MPALIVAAVSDDGRRPLTKKSPVSILIGASSDAMDDRQKAILKDVAVAIGEVCTVAGVVIAALAIRLTVVASHTDQRAWLGLFEADVAPQLAFASWSWSTNARRSPWVCWMYFLSAGKSRGSRAGSARRAPTASSSA
jgi:hypothetical protein